MQIELFGEPGTLIDPTPYTLTAEELARIEADLPSSAKAPTQEARAIAAEMATNILVALGDSIPDETRKLLSPADLACRVFSMPRTDFLAFYYAWLGMREEADPHALVNC